MKKLLLLAKTNLLGIAVAIGVISFLFEGLILPDENYTFTKFSVLLVIIIAIRSKYKENAARQKSLFKKSILQKNNTPDLNNSDNI